jgi:dienelactone hydrolase
MAIPPRLLPLRAAIRSCTSLLCGALVAGAPFQSAAAADLRRENAAPDPARDPAAFTAWQSATRAQLRSMLGIPTERVALDPESRGSSEHDGIVVEKWIFTSERGSRVPAVLFRPKQPGGAMPAIVFTYGHGSSKSSWSYNYAAQLYAKLGVACLAIDPLGEEERHLKGRTGTRAHDPQPVHDRAQKAGRLIMGKLVFDTMRALDFLETRSDINRAKLGVAGYSLGGAKAGWMAALDPRLKLAIVAGWAYDDVNIETKFCTRVPNERMRAICTWSDFAAVAAAHCAVLIPNGEADVVIDRHADGSAWRGTNAALGEARRYYAALGSPAAIEQWIEPGGGHRPYFAFPIALEWIHRHLGTPGWSLQKIQALPFVNAGSWCDTYGITLERLYGTALHWRGAMLPDLGIRPTPASALQCLRPDELGQPQFTIEGWLDQIDANARGHRQPH